VFQQSVCMKDYRTDCNNYVVVNYYQLQNTTLSNILLSSLTAHAAELDYNQEYGFVPNQCKCVRAVIHIHFLCHVIM
jgi:hypothetical protein